MFGDQLQRNRIKGPPCTVSVIREQMGEEERAKLDDTMKDRNYWGSQIGEELRREGYMVNNAVVNRHRKGECVCARPQNAGQ